MLLDGIELNPEARLDLFMNDLTFLRNYTRLVTILSNLPSVYEKETTRESNIVGRIKIIVESPYLLLP